MVLVEAQTPNGETTKPNRNPKPKKKIGEDSEEDGEKGTRYETLATRIPSNRI